MEVRAIGGDDSECRTQRLVVPHDQMHQLILLDGNGVKINMEKRLLSLEGAAHEIASAVIDDYIRRPQIDIDPAAS